MAAEGNACAGVGTLAETLEAELHLGSNSKRQDIPAVKCADSEVHNNYHGDQCAAIDRMFSRCKAGSPVPHEKEEVEKLVSEFNKEIQIQDVRCWELYDQMWSNYPNSTPESNDAAHKQYCIEATKLSKMLEKFFELSGEYYNQRPRVQYDLDDEQDESAGQG